MEEITQEKQKISERLARLEAERAKLMDQLNELEITERVLSRFGRSVAPVERRRRGRPARTPAASTGGRRTRTAPPTEGLSQGLSQGLSMSEAALKAVETHGEGPTAPEILDYLSREFGLTVRPNHLGIALQRHRRAGRLESRDGHWYLPQSASDKLPQQVMTE